MTMSDHDLTGHVRAWLDQPALSPLWDRTHARLQRNGRAATGRLRLPVTSDDQRDALSMLTGRALKTARADVSIDLAELDAALRASAAGRGLLAVVTALRGPVADRRGDRQQRAADWQQTWSAAEAHAATALAGSSWVQSWLDEVRATRSVTRLGPQRAAELLGQAIAILAVTVPTGGPSAQVPRGRAELAAQFTGTAHGLDDGTVLARLVLHGLARALDRPVPDPRSRRDLWESAGIHPDTVATTVLTYALVPPDDGPLAGVLRLRAAHHAEAHLTARDLRSLQWTGWSGGTVHICENPRILEAAADARCARPIICTSGNPTYTVLTLLDALAAAGTEFAYHGDFDWPGIAIANRIITAYPARSWRMGAADYEHQVQLAQSRATPPQQLSGEPVDASWDPELTAAMRTIGVTIHEESALESLLDDLSEPS